MYLIIKRIEKNSKTTKMDNSLYLQMNVGNNDTLDSITEFN